MSTHCSGTGRLPCTCGAAEYTAARGYFRAPPPCTCGDLECPGCEACTKPADDAERARRHAAMTADLERMRAERAARDGQGRLF